MHETDEQKRLASRSNVFFENNQLDFLAQHFVLIQRYATKTRKKLKSHQLHIILCITFSFHIIDIAKLLLYQKTSVQLESRLTKRNLLIPCLRVVFLNHLWHV